ncbi:MAG: DUF4390 domain-containing protein, partial [Thermodesulfobacteriota bacterium]|nr:DUF4390 domain-containing protein [Thermodesulfobacteriota bacterium]
MRICKIFTVLCLFFLPVEAFAAEAKVTDLIITNTSENLLVYLKGENCFTRDMEEAILAGIPTTFTFILELQRERHYWFDKKESFLEVKHTIKYDNIKKIFYVVFTEHGRNPEQFKEFAKAKIAMSELNGIVFTSLRQMTKGDRYYLRVKAKLEKVRLPLHLEYIFFFVSLWDFETD